MWLLQRHLWNIVQVFKIPGTFECAAINPIFIEEKGATFIYPHLIKNTKQYKYYPKFGSVLWF